MASVPKSMSIRSGTAKIPLQPDGVNKGLTLIWKAFIDRLRGENRN